MFELRCTVRNCPELLSQREGSLLCPAGHCFDRAKEGYWSLLQPQDRKSKNPGDHADAVLARHRWLNRGHAVGLVDALRPWIDATRLPGNRITCTLDLGCGEGYFGPAMFDDPRENYCGIDLSKRAVRLASRRWKEATWVLANADRFLPVADASVGRVMSLFGRRPVAEIRRVLIPDGHCIVAVPAENDLVELREEVQQAGHQRSRWKSIVDDFAQQQFVLVEQSTWRHKLTLDSQSIADAMAMTYRGVRRSQQKRLNSVSTTMEVTLSADLLLFRLDVAEPC